MATYKPLSQNLQVNKNLPYIFHIDMNSYFASCEQQQNPFLRGKPVGVVPYLNDRSTIIAASYEAKALGIKTGTRVAEAKEICPNINLVLADVNKYRYINKKFMKVFKQFTPSVHAKSIDEAYLDFSGMMLKRMILNKDHPYKNLSERQIHKKMCEQLANNIKQRLKNEVGDYITCSIGVGTNTFIAKVASNINKPDGYYYVDYKNIYTFYDVLDLIDLHGVGPRINKRLNDIGIFTCKQFLEADIYKLRSEFKLWGYQWYLKLRGFETDDIDFKRKNIGHSFHLTKFSNEEKYLKIVMLKLCEKTGSKLRKLGFKARCFSVFLNFSDGTHYAKSHRINNYLDSTKDLYREFIWVFDKNPYKNKRVRIIGISCSMLTSNKKQQPDLFGEKNKKESFYKAVDSINNNFGKFTVYPAILKDYKDVAPDRIAFGK